MPRPAVKTWLALIGWQPGGFRGNAIAGSPRPGRAAGAWPGCLVGHPGGACVAGDVRGCLALCRDLLPRVELALAGADPRLCPVEADGQPKEKAPPPRRFGRCRRAEQRRANGGAAAAQPVAGRGAIDLRYPLRTWRSPAGYRHLLSQEQPSGCVPARASSAHRARNHHLPQHPRGGHSWPSLRLSGGKERCLEADRRRAHGRGGQNTDSKSNEILDLRPHRRCDWSAACSVGAIRKPRPQGDRDCGPGRAPPLCRRRPSPAPRLREPPRAPPGDAHEDRLTHLARHRPRRARGKVRTTCATHGSHLPRNLACLTNVPRWNRPSARDRCIARGAAVYTPIGPAQVNREGADGDAGPSLEAPPARFPPGVRRDDLGGDSVRRCEARRPFEKSVLQKSLFRTVSC